MDEIPVGAVIVKDNVVIAKAHNMKETNKNVIDHAEIMAIIEASKVLNNWRLEECDIYITLDPCPMCASAIKQARIKNVYSALRKIDNNVKVVEKIFEINDINSSLNFVTNLAESRSKFLLQEFFKKKR